MCLLSQKKEPTITGAYILELSFGRPDKRYRDLGNLEKAVSDLLVHHKIIEDDRFAERIVLQWEKDLVGCRVEVGIAREFETPLPGVGGN